MANYISDSDVEEVVSPAPSRLKPRVVRRPVPVRTQSATSGQDSTFAGAISDSDSSDADDDDFFRLNRAPSATEEESEKAATLGNSPGTTPRQLSTDNNIVSLENSDSDAEAEEQDSIKHSTSAKRRHDSEQNGEQERRVRSRSVSLTPPPEAARVNGGAESERLETDHKEPVESFVLESESETEEQSRAAEDFGTSDLDPALQAVIQSEAMTPSRGGSVGPANQLASPQPYANSPATRTHHNAVLEKVQIEFRFIFDPEFLASELPCIWEQKRWGRIKSTSAKTIEKKLNGQIAIIAFTSELVANVLKAYSDAFYIDVLATDPVLMNGTMRVFPTSTVASLGSDLAFYIKVFPRSVYNRWHEQEILEKTQLAMEQEQARRDMENALQKHTASGIGLPDLDGTDVQESGTAATAGGIRIKVRDRAGKDTLLLVTTETSVETVIKNYRQLAKLPETTRIQLEFDDEVLNPSDTIGDTEIEDDDMLTAIWK
ncbi:hypothetical protein IWW36_001056 [Coemansia brasiliensis]|uniref:Rad60/SUMO-like domain-containing protein n=1 Tax=Coemansia brasiliensis TaxID=2650707 RepID=A0A9W8ICJ3_9FUNG|nr:hypothetical protein IWW36_001056 [Coemansia brasiliensis]